MHILNGLSLDLLATLEEEKDSCVCQFGAVWGSRENNRRFDSSNEHSWLWFARVSVCEQFACLSASRERGVIKLEQI